MKYVSSINPISLQTKLCIAGTVLIVGGVLSDCQRRVEMNETENKRDAHIAFNRENDDLPLLEREKLYSTPDFRFRYEVSHKNLNPKNITYNKLMMAEKVSILANLVLLLCQLV